MRAFASAFVLLAALSGCAVVPYGPNVYGPGVVVQPQVVLSGGYYYGHGGGHGHGRGDGYGRGWGGRGR